MDMNGFKNLRVRFEGRDYILTPARAHPLGWTCEAIKTFTPNDPFAPKP